jgi:hypothetical protein
VAAGWLLDNLVLAKNGLLKGKKGAECESTFLLEQNNDGTLEAFQ